MCVASSLNIVIQLSLERLFDFLFSEPKETLEEAFEALQNGETEGFLLDAYVAGSGVDSFIKTSYQVNKIIDTKKGLGVVLSGEAVVLRHRVRDFVKKNAEKITEIIQRSTSPLKVSKHNNQPLYLDRLDTSKELLASR